MLHSFNLRNADSQQAKLLKNEFYMIDSTGTPANGCPGDSGISFSALSPGNGTHGTD